MKQFILLPLLCFFIFGARRNFGKPNLNTRKRQSQCLKITEARIRRVNGQTSGVSPVQFTDFYDEAGQATGTRVEVRIG